MMQFPKYTDNYKNEEIILDSSDYIDINISEYSNQKNNS